MKNPRDDLTALAPCPFCGGSNISRDLYIRDGRMVKCQGCGASTYDYNPNASTGAIAKWNTRAAATHAPALDREAVAAMADRFWRIHPKELDEIGLERREFYAREIEALFRSALLPAAPVEPKPAGEGEPVAWRWRPPGAALWIYNPEPEWLEAHRHEIDCEPLYAAPIPSPAADVERLRKILDFARRRIEYYGQISARHHFEHDLREVLPRINAVLDSSSVPSPAPAGLREALLDATAHLVAAASAYRKHASRHRSVGRAETDPFFSTRVADFEKAAGRAQTAIRSLSTNREGE